MLPCEVFLSLLYEALQYFILICPAKYFDRQGHKLSEKSFGLPKVRQLQARRVLDPPVCMPA